MVFGYSRDVCLLYNIITLSCACTGTQPAALTPEGYAELESLVNSRINKKTARLSSNYGKMKENMVFQ